MRFSLWDYSEVKGGSDVNGKDDGTAVSDPQRTGHAGQGERSLAWWRRHCEPLGGDAATRAKLRRCRSALDALTVPAAVSLVRQLGAHSSKAQDNDRRLIAALGLARVLSHVTQHVPDTAMRVVGWRSFPEGRKEGDAGRDRPKLAEVRFRRLLATGSGEEQVATFARLVSLLGGTVNVSAFASDFLDWTHPSRGDRVRQRWAFDYYAAGIAAPATTPTPDEVDTE